MKKTKRDFDAAGFYKALATTASVRGKNWKDVSLETGVSASTLSRMATGSRPDAGSLAILSAWAGIDAAGFVSGARGKAEPLALVGKLLREDPNLDDGSARALEAIIRTAYERLSTKSESSAANKKK